MRKVFCAFVALALASCSQQKERTFSSAGCRHFADSLAVDVASPKPERSELELFIFDSKGVTFHVSPSYFAKPFSQIDLVEYKGSGLKITFTENGAGYSYLVSGVDNQCGSRAIGFWEEQKSLRSQE